MPRLCAGCGQLFASNEAFEMHATGSAHPLPDSPRRCRTVAEMRSIGMSKSGPPHAKNKGWTTTNRNPKLKRQR